MMKQVLFLYCLLLITPNISMAKSKIAPYILDGSLVIYTPTVQQGVAVWAKLMKQTTGVEYANATNRLTMRLVEKISANIFTPVGAKALGINYYGGVAYVHLDKNVSYMIFTVENVALLRSRLDNLENPIPYRIVEDFVIFSASPEVLEYYQFKGLTKIDEYNKVAKELNLSWDKNLIWLDSSFFYQQAIMSMGDRIIGTFNIIDNKIILDVFTIYNDPQIKTYISNAQKVSRVQKLTLLDYEFGMPSIVGNLYVDVDNFIKLGHQIDKAKLLNINNIFDILKKRNIDIQKNIVPYLQGRLSYVIRTFKPSEKDYDFTFTVGVKNTKIIKSKLKEIAQQSKLSGITIHYKDLFTQQFYGWEINKQTFWVGIIENHLVFSSDEKSLISYVQNIYQGRSGFLTKLPIPMRRSINNRHVGGQMFVKNPEFIQNVEVLDWFFAQELLLGLKNMTWDFHLINNKNISGRRDIFNFDFTEEINH